MSGVSALRPLLWDLRLAGVRGLLALRLPVKDFVAVIIIIIIIINSIDLTEKNY